uniref:Uncharacterized protein n=1 Tax=Anguilla anguilla TaxID=7936 RepID=A0A0E9W4N8_ANGAN
MVHKNNHSGIYRHYALRRDSIKTDDRPLVQYMHRKIITFQQWSVL